jgi:two-component system, NtrC family, sensor kinase
LGADRIKNIVKSVSIFSGWDEAKLKEVNLHESIDSTLMILQHRLKEQPHHCAIQIIKDYQDLPLFDYS